MAFSAGSIFGKLGFDISDFKKGMMEVNALSSIFPQTVNNFLANPLLGLMDLAKRAGSMIKNAFLDAGRAADNIGEIAERAGVSVEFLSGVGWVAKDAGSSVEGLAEAMKFLANNAADAANGSQTAQQAFGMIGVSVADSAGQLKSNERIFWEVSDAIAKLPTAAQKTQAAMNLMGRGGTEMIPTLNKGSAGIQEMVRTFESLGAVTSTATAEMGDKFGTLETLFEAAWRGIRNEIAKPLLGYVSEHFDQIVQGLKEFSSQVRERVREMMPSLVGSIPEMAKTAAEVFVGLIKGIKLLGQTLAWCAEHFELIKNAFVGILAWKVGNAVINTLAGSFDTLGKSIAGATASGNKFSTWRSGLGGAAAGFGMGTMIGGGGSGSMWGSGIGGLLGMLVGGYFGGPWGAQFGGMIGGSAGGWIGGKFDDKPQPVNVQANVTLDPAATADQISAKITPEFRAALQRTQARMDSEFSSERVQRGLGGEQ